MNAVQRKLQDRSGATLTVALLFFIMCAAAGSVILAAATTSTGRLAELQASDQNYYAVVSAAKLIRDEIDGLCAYIDELFGEENMNECKDYLRMLKKLV